MSFTSNERGSVPLERIAHLVEEKNTHWNHLILNVSFERLSSLEMHRWSPPRRTSFSHQSHVYVLGKRFDMQVKGFWTPYEGLSVLTLEGSCFLCSPSTHTFIYLYRFSQQFKSFGWSDILYAQALSICLVGSQQSSIDRLHTGRAGEGAHQPGINAVHVIDVHAGEEPDWVAVFKVHHADYTPRRN